MHVRSGRSSDLENEKYVIWAGPSLLRALSCCSHLGVFGRPASSCCPPLPPSSSQAVAAGHESGPLSVAKPQEGKVSVYLVPISQAPT